MNIQADAPRNPTRFRGLSRAERNQAWRNWQDLGAELHNVQPGDGVYVKGRLMVYAGAGILPQGYVGRRWVSLCSVCGAQMEWIQVPYEKPAAIICDTAGRPDWRGPKRCLKHRNPKKRTGYGFEDNARHELYRRGLQAFHQPTAHYVFRKDPGDTLERLGVTIDRRAELLAGLF